MALGQKEVRLSIKANTDKFQAELKKLPGVTDKQAKKMAGKFAKQFDKVERDAKKSSAKMANSYKGSFGKMGKASGTFKNLLAVGVFAAAAKGIFHLADSASIYVDKIGVMSRQTGLNTDTLVAMEFASQAAGLSLDNLSAGLNTFTNKAGQAHNVGGAATRIFDRLGISVEDTGGNLRSMDVLFRETVQALADMDSVAEQATTAIELFGARGSKIAAVFGDGTGALDLWTAKAKEAGLVMDDKAKKASVDMDHAMAELKLTMRATSMEIGSDLVPAMVLVTKAIGKVIQQIAKAVNLWDRFTDSMFGNIDAGQKQENAWHGMQEAFKEIRRGLKDYDGEFKDHMGLTQTGPSILRKLESAYRAFGDTAGEAIAQGKPLSRSEQKQWDDFTKLLDHAANAMGMNFFEMQKGAQGAREEILSLQKEDFSDLEGELDALGKKTAGVKTEAENAAQRMADLNRSFELEALARVDKPLADFEKEIDRINRALLAGLSSDLGHDAIAAAIADLDTARIEEHTAELERISDELAAALDAIDAEAEAEAEAAEARQELYDKQAERDADRIKAKREAEEEAAKAAAELQAEFLEGTADLANNVFELAKSQRGISFQEEQALAIAQAIMNTAIGVSKELATKGIAGIATGAIVAAEGALQIAAIKSQTMHAGGIVGGSPDERPANLLTGEAVITRAGVEAIGGASGVQAINSGAGGGQIVVVNQYKHRTLDVQLRDQLRSGGVLSRAVSGGGRMGHR